jgi:hypothetical protein
MAMPLTHHRFTVDEYHRMADAGILTEDDRVPRDRAFTDRQTLGRDATVSPLHRPNLVIPVAQILG